MLQKLLIGSAPLLPKFVSGAPQDITNFGNGALERDDFSSNRHPALSFCLSMIFSENRYPLFRIMLWDADPSTGSVFKNQSPVARRPEFQRWQVLCRSFLNRHIWPNRALP